MANSRNADLTHLMTTSSLLASLVAASMSVAVAQETAPSASVSETDETTSSIEEIIVTARRRSESLAKVPQAISVFGGQALDELVLTDITDIAELTPGLAMQNNSRQNEQPFIRGASVNSFFKDSQNTSFFHDGIFVGGVARTMGVDDVQQIEVVRGPQAVYFGRQTFAGAINYVSKKPTFDWQGHARAEVAQFGRYEASGGISGPIIDDVLAFRAYVQVGEYDGAFGNELDNFRVQTEETLGGSFSLTFRPTDNVDFTARAQIVEFEDGHNASVLVGADQNNCKPNTAGVFQAICGKIPIPDGIALNLESLEFPGGRRTVEQERYSLIGNIDLGFATLETTTAYNTDENVNSADGDATPTPVFGFTFSSEYEDFTQQLILRSRQEQRFRWLLGALYFESERIESSLTFPFTSLSSPRDVENQAVFGSVEYDVTEALTVAFEGRYQSDDIQRSDPTTGEVLQSETFTSFLPRVVVDYEAGNGLFLYALAGKGNQPGDFNTNAGVREEDIAIEEQELWNYEIGARKVYGDGAGLLSVNAYYIDWTNQVVQETIPGGPDAPTPTVVANTNAGETEIFGLEFENSFRFGEHLNTRVTYAYTHAEYQDFLSNVPARFAENDDIVGNVQVGGNMLQNTPEHMASALATYQAPLTIVQGNWDWFVSGDYSYRSSQFLDESNTAKIGALNLVNARVGVDSGAFRATFYVRNLTDTETPAFATRFSDFSRGFNPSYLVALREPRTIGLRLDYAF